jgi:hypothetical protein
MFPAGMGIREKVSPKEVKEWGRDFISRPTDVPHKKPRVPVQIAIKTFFKILLMIILNFIFQIPLITLKIKPFLLGLHNTINQNFN